MFYRPPDGRYNLFQMPHITNASAPGGPGVRILGGGTASSAAWGLANRAIFVPLHLSGPYTIRRMFFGVGTTGGTNNADIGLYDLAGNKLVSSGSTLVGTASTIQYLDVTDTTVGPGSYYLALVMNGTTATFQRQGYTNEMGKYTGALVMTSAFALPATATYAALAGVNVPIIGITNRASP